MREIKFRVWDKKKAKMLDYKWVHLDQEGEGFVEQYGTDPHIRQEDYELMQYTSLKDKNGKEIYEGDVLRNTVNDMWHKVEFEKGCYKGSFMSHGNICGGCSVNNIGDLDMNFYEVIGNIYEG